MVFLKDICFKIDWGEMINKKIKRQVMAGSHNSDEMGIAVKSVAKTKKPSMYKVLMLNDDYTPMEFVVKVLQSYFSMSQEKAMQIMLHVHQRGVGICGVYTFEVAEMKVTQVMESARDHQHPLQCTIEKDGAGEKE